jgi:hypothetical protein
LLLRRVRAGVRAEEDSGRGERIEPRAQRVEPGLARHAPD